MDDRDVALAYLLTKSENFNKMVYDTCFNDIKIIYSGLEEEGFTDEFIETATMGTYKIPDGNILRKWVPVLDDNFKFNTHNPCHDIENKSVDIINLPFDQYPDVWREYNKDIGLIANVLISGIVDFDVYNRMDYIGKYTDLFIRLCREYNYTDLFDDEAKLDFNNQNLFAFLNLNHAIISRAAYESFEPEKRDKLDNVNELYLENTIDEIIGIKEDIFDYYGVPVNNNNKIKKRSLIN